MERKSLEAFAREAAKGLKDEKDLNEFGQVPTKITVKVALNAELDEKILSLFAKGMTTREIAATFKERYDADICKCPVNLS